MAGEIKHVDQIGGSIPDDPLYPIKGTEWDKALRLSGGTDGQILTRSTAADGTTGMTLTSTPTAISIVFPLTPPGGTPANGSFWVEDDGVTVTLWVKRASGALVSLELG